MSTGLNSMTGVIFEDIIQPLSGGLSERMTSFVLKIVVVLIGVLCVAMVFVVEHLGTLFQMTKSLLGITNGPLLGLFTLGMFFPTANSIGALTGGVTALCIMSWISIGAQSAISKGLITYPTKSVNTSGCSEPLPHLYTPTPPTLLSFEMKSELEPLYMFRLSYMWYAMIGTIITISVGLVVSHFTPHSKRIDRELFSPVIHKFLPESNSEVPQDTDMNGVELKAAIMKLKENIEGNRKRL